MLVDISKSFTEEKIIPANENMKKCLTLLELFDVYLIGKQ